MTFEWEQLFADGSLPDKRLRARAIRIGRATTDRPGAAMTSAFDHRRDTRTAYNFFSNRRVSFAMLIDSASTVVGQRLQQLPEGTTVLNVHDTTEANLSHLQSMTGLGEIGNPHNRGLFLHPSLAISSDGVPIGVLSAQIWTRAPGDHGKAKKRKKVRFEDKESLRWWTAIEQAETRVQRPGLLLHVADRESDIYEVFHRAQQAGYRILLRAAQDRRVEGEHRTLWCQVNSFTPCQQARPLSVPARPAKEGKPARAARDTSVVVRYGSVTLCDPESPATVQMGAVQVTEVDPPQGVEPIEWLLLTSQPVSSTEQAWQQVQWYRYRWRIEEFFQVLKSGCRIEARQFESRENYETSLAFALLTAVRILGMVKKARVEPEVPASVSLSEEEQRVLVRHAESTRNRAAVAPPLRLAEAVVLIAKLGGYQGRSCDGPPGWITIWRGLRRLEDMVEGSRLAQQPHPPPSGPTTTVTAGRPGHST
jgi:hypothetical protein